MDPRNENHALISRSRFLRQTSLGIGSLALASLLDRGITDPGEFRRSRAGWIPQLRPAPRRVIYLFQSGAPSQMELFDHKPLLERLSGTELPDSIRQGQRLTGMTSRQTSFPVAASRFRFAQHGRHAATCERALAAHGQGRGRPVFHQIDAHRGDQPRPGHHVLPDRGAARRASQHRLMAVLRPGEREPGSAGFRRLGIAGDRQPQRSAAVRPALGQRVPANQVPGSQIPRRRATRSCSSRILREWTVRAVGECSTTWPASIEIKHREVGDPEITTRITQYELASRMQASVPELTDLSDGAGHRSTLYGPEVRKPGSFAANCLLARRLAERGVRFIQLFHRGWDQHVHLPKQIAGQCRDTDQPSAGTDHRPEAARAA